MESLENSLLVGVGETMQSHLNYMKLIRGI